MGGSVRCTVSRSGQARALTAAVQFPAARLDAGLAALKPLGMIVEESLKGEDVTEQIVDVEARLSNARNTEKRLLDLLQKRQASSKTCWPRSARSRASAKRSSASTPSARASTGA